MCERPMNWSPLIVGTTGKNSVLHYKKPEDKKQTDAFWNLQRYSKLLLDKNKLVFFY